MKPLIITKETEAARRFNSHAALTSAVHRGDMKANISGVDVEEIDNSDVIMSSSAWEGTKEFNEHWNKIDDALSDLKKNGLKQNTEQLDAAYYDLVNMVTQDMTRRRMQELDLTSVVSNEITNGNFSKAVALQEFLEYIGVFEKNDLTGESVPLMQQNLGAEGSVIMQGYALGAVRALADVLYNLDVYTLQKENAAFTRAFIARRNDLVMSPIVGASYVAAQSQAAVDTSGLSLDEKIYETILGAYKKLIALYDFQTGQEIDAGMVRVGLGSNADLFSVERVIGGQLDNSKGLTANRRALPVDGLFKYSGDSVMFKKKRVTFSGIAANTGYMFVPGMAGAPHYTLTKRGLTTEVGNGDVLQLAQKAAAKYFVQTSYYDEFLGSSGSNSVITGAEGNFGFIVKFALPTP